MNEPDDNHGEIAKRDIFDRDGALSREFLLRRGYCCDLGCKNCPYRADADGGTGAA